MQIKIIGSLLPYQYWHCLNSAKKSQTKPPRGIKFHNAVKGMRFSVFSVKNAYRFRSKPFNNRIFRMPFIDEVSDFLDDIEVQNGPDQ